MNTKNGTIYRYKYREKGVFTWEVIHGPATERIKFQEPKDIITGFK